LTKKSKKIALVTGSSRGIGRSIAIQLAANNMDVVINYKNQIDAAKKVVDEIINNGGKAIAVQSDITNSSEVESMFSTIESKLGNVGILINNAGIIKDSLLIRMSENDWDEVINLDLKAVFLCTKAALRPMLRERWGRIINVGSVIGLKGQKGQANYAAAKAGLIGLTQTVAMEVASRNITVNYVAPGYVETDIVENLSSERKALILNRIPLGRFAHPDEIASLVTFLVSDQASYITSQIITVDGGMMNS
jgi:3-oxoacyl-[acyl-carrier protein] reductase